MVWHEAQLDMKRSSALASLSRDHHAALVLARQLSHASEQTSPAVAERLVQFLSGHELTHFAPEELVLVPALLSEARGSECARRMLEDHEHLRAAMRHLRETPDEVSAGFLHELGARLRAHVLMEEREIFPYLEKSLDAAQLEALGARLAQAPADHAVAIVQQFLTAVLERDVETLVALSDPDVTLRPLRLTDTFTYNGHPGVRRWIEDLNGRARQLSFHVDEIRSVDVWHALARVHLDAHGEELARATAVFTVRVGRVSEVRGYFSDEELLSSVGAI